MDLIIYTGASDLSQAFVTSPTDLTPVAEFPALVYGDTEPLTVRLTTSAAGATPSWLGVAGHVVDVSLGLLSSDGGTVLSRTTDFTFSSPTYSGNLFLASSAFGNWLNGRTQPRGYVFLQVRHTNPAGETETLAAVMVPVQGTIPAANGAADTPVDYATYADVLAAKVAAEAAAAQADLDAQATAADAIATNADAIATAADRAQTGLDRIATGADRVQTGLDVQQTGADRVATGQDAAATAADRVQTGLDALATANDAASAAASATAATQALAGLYLGGVAGNAVPATATAAGYYYRITSAGTSQSITWAVGDLAIYNGTSGSWTQLSGLFPFASTAEALAGTDNTKALTPLTGNARALLGDATRTVADSLYFDGATTSARAYAALGTAGNLATSPLSVVGLFTNDATSISVALGLFYFGSASTAYAANSLAVYRNNDNLVIEIVGATPGTDFRRLTAASWFTTARAGVIPFAFTFDRLVAPIFYADGAAVTFAETTGGTAPAWTAAIDSTFFVAGIRGATERWFGTLSVQAVLNRAMTASGVLTLAQAGTLPDSDNFATGTVVPGYDSDFSAGTNSWNGVSSTVVTGNQDGIGGRDDCLLIEVGGSVANASRNSHPFAASRRTRVQLSVYFPSSNATMNGIRIGDNASSVAITVGSGGFGNTQWTNLATDTWHDLIIEVIPGRLRDLSTIRLQGLRGTAGSNSMTAGDKMYVRGLVFTTLGPIAKWQMQPIAVAADTGANKIPLVLTAGVTPRTQRRDWVIQGQTNTSGNQQLLGASVFFDSTRQMLDTIEVNAASGTPTVGVGSASGGAQYVTAAAIATGRNRRTLVTPVVGTANLWVSSNSTDVLQHTIRGHIID